jgi:hypothetical protein
VPVAIKVADLGPLAAAVNASLVEARRDMDPCFKAEAAALEKSPPPEPPPGEEPLTSSAVLVLHLEARERGLDVTGTELETLGTSTRELVTCCERVLRNWAIAADRASPGKRYRLKMMLQ